MNKLGLILKEQFSSLGIIYRIANYENKASYQGHYLGLAWEILNPTIQVITFYVVFGVGLHRGREVRDVPFITWMLVGMAVWFFMNKVVLESSKSIQRKIGMVSKMKFPVSVLPTIVIVSQLKTFFVMMGLAIGSALFVGIFPTIHWFQFLYYFVAMIAFLLFIGLLSSTITILVRDFHFILQAVMRLLFYTSGTILVISDMFTGRFGRLLQLIPFNYLIRGFRNVMLYQGMIFEDTTASLFFWVLVLLIALLATHLHLKFRSRFMDFM